MRYFILALLLLLNDVFILLYDSGVLPIPSISIVIALIVLLPTVQFRKKLGKTNSYLIIWMIVIWVSMLLNKPNYNFLFHFLIYVMFFLLFSNSEKITLTIKFFTKLLSIYAVVYIALYLAANLGVRFDFFTFKYYESGRFIFLFNEPLNAGFALLIALYFSLRTSNIIQIILITIALLFVQSFTFQLLGLLLIIYSYRELIQKKTIQYLSVVLFPFLGYMLFNLYSQRFQSIISLSEGSTRVRIAQLLRDIDIIKNNFFLGVGHGNSSQMTFEYLNEFSSSLSNYELNYSNTLFEIFTGSGFFGFLFALLFFNRILFGNNIVKLLLFLLFLTNGFFLYPLLWFFLIFLYQESRLSQKKSLHQKEKEQFIGTSTLCKE